MSVSVLVEPELGLTSNQGALDEVDQLSVLALPPGLVMFTDLVAGTLPPAVPEKLRDDGDNAMDGLVEDEDPPVRFKVTDVLVVLTTPLGSTRVIRIVSVY
ncbi:hypothetical protein W02_01720 [Nitrospira sp. KM1]|nr:hypothetical protein W02_01720 [Nitrospira sp. KM1]